MADEELGGSAVAVETTGDGSAVRLGDGRWLAGVGLGTAGACEAATVALGGV